MSAVYGSTRYGYDFEAEMEAALSRSRERKRTPVSASKDLGLLHLAGKATIVVPSKTSHPWKPDSKVLNLDELDAPTPEALRRHAERFGPEGVQEIADAYGVDLTETTKVNRGRGRATGTRGLKQAERLLGEEAA